jgi:hypothetical protein
MKWILEVPVKQARGVQIYEVEAETEEEAIRKFKTEDDAVFVSEEIEVIDQDLDWITATEKEA